MMRKNNYAEWQQVHNFSKIQCPCCFTFLLERKSVTIENGNILCSPGPKRCLLCGCTLTDVVEDAL
jgi:hypothetical protein